MWNELQLTSFQSGSYLHSNDVVEVMHLNATLACSTKISGAIPLDSQYSSELSCTVSFCTENGGKAFLPLQGVKICNRNTRIDLDGNVHRKAPVETMEQSSKATSQWKSHSCSCYLSIMTDHNHNNMWNEGASKQQPCRRFMDIK